MHPKLNDHAKSDERTRDIWYQPSGILHHLEDGRRIVVIKARLVESHALVAQRVIHVDQRFPIFMAGRIQQSNSAREVLGNISPRVTIVAKLNELNRKRFIEAFGLQHDLIILATGLKTYRPGKARCETPGADVSPALPDRYGSSWHVAFVLFVGPFCLDRYSHRADLEMWIVRGRQLIRAQQGRVDKIFVDPNL